MDYMLYLNNFKCVKMKLFFLLWILPVTLGDTYVTCIYSEECMLPCSSTHLDIIHWYLDKKVVHSYFYNKDQLGHQHEDYKGRTSLLPESEIKNGNISLLIRNIRVQDEGRYRCYTADTNKNDEKYVVMSVKAPVKSVNIRLKDDTVICTSSGVYPEPKVAWHSDPPVMEPPDTTVSRTEDNLFTVTSQLKVDVITDTYTFNCSITTEDTHYTASLKQLAASELPENEFSFECQTDKQGLYSVESKLKKLKDLTYICLVQSFYRSQTWRASLQEKEIFGVEGQDFIIPCVAPWNLQNFTLTWSFTKEHKSTTIYTYDSLTQQSSSIWKRVRLVTPRGRGGDGSLQLHNPLSLEHTGTYTCILSAHQTKHEVHTRVNIIQTKYEVHSRVSITEAKHQDHTRVNITLKPEKQQSESSPQWWITAVITGIAVTAVATILGIIKCKAGCTKSSKTHAEATEMQPIRVTVANSRAASEDTCLTEEIANRPT